MVKAGGSTLAQTYATLTGKPPSEAISDLGALLNDHFRAGAAFQVPGDNIFPLYSPPVIACYASPYFVGTPVSLGSTPFEAAICHSPEAQYSYETDTAPPASGNNPPPFAAELGITYIVNSISPTESQLLVRNTDFPGNCSLAFTVSAEEALVADQLAGETTLTSAMTTLTYTMSSSYWAAFWPCIARPIAEASLSLTALGSLAVLLNTPDPAPEQISAAAAAMTSYLAGLAEITGGAIGQQGSAASVVSAARRLPPSLARSIRAAVDGGLPALSVSSQTVSLRAGRPPGRDSQSRAAE